MIDGDMRMIDDLISLKINYSLDRFLASNRFGKGDVFHEYFIRTCKFIQNNVAYT